MEEGSWLCLDDILNFFHKYMYGVLNEVYLRIFLQITVTFRDESNESSFIMISYNDATVTTSNHPLIVRSKTSLAIATDTVP